MSRSCKLIMLQIFIISIVNDDCAMYKLFHILVQMPPLINIPIVLEI